MKEEAALTRTIADIRLPGPITESDVRDIEQALMGDYKDEYYQERGAMVWMPQATAFEDRLKNSKVDNLNIDSAARRYRFLVPFIIKAELNPGLAFGEGILTWIHFLSRKCEERNELGRPYIESNSHDCVSYIQCFLCSIMDSVSLRQLLEDLLFLFL
jgi:hypothetical protein